MQEIKIPNSVTAIKTHTFDGCTKLKSMEIPDSVTSIATFSFYNCKALKTVYIPSSVVSIGANTNANCPFYGCSSTLVVFCQASRKQSGWGGYWDCLGRSSSNKAIVLYNITHEDYKIYEECRNSTEAIIPDTLTKIPDYLFYGCTELTSVYIPNTIKTIGNNAFQGCTGLNAIYIPSSVTTITTSSVTASPFYNCSSTLKIYCEAGAKKSGWGSYWNYYASGKALSTVYGVTREEYENLLISTTTSLLDDGVVNADDVLIETEDIMETLTILPDEDSVDEVSTETEENLIDIETASEEIETNKSANSIEMLKNTENSEEVSLQDNSEDMQALEEMSLQENDTVMKSEDVESNWINTESDN